MKAAAKTQMRSGVHLWLLLWRATRAVENLAHQSIRATGLCLSDFGVLEALLHKGPLPVNALQKKVLLSSGSMTAAVDRLERRGWVERTFAATDRRARIVRLTGAGSRLIRRLFAAHARAMEDAFAGLEAPEREGFAGVLRKLSRNAEGRAGRKSSTIRNKRTKTGRS